MLVMEYLFDFNEKKKNAFITNDKELKKIIRKG